MESMAEILEICQCLYTKVQDLIFYLADSTVPSYITINLDTWDHFYNRNVLMLFNWIYLRFPYFKFFIKLALRKFSPLIQPVLKIFPSASHLDPSVKIATSKGLRRVSFFHSSLLMIRNRLTMLLKGGMVSYFSLPFRKNNCWNKKTTLSKSRILVHPSPALSYNLNHFYRILLPCVQSFYL